MGAVTELQEVLDQECSIERLCEHDNLYECENCNQKKRLSKNKN